MYCTFVLLICAGDRAQTVQSPAVLSKQTEHLRADIRQWGSISLIDILQQATATLRLLVPKKHIHVVTCGRVNYSSLKYVCNGYITRGRLRGSCIMSAINTLHQTNQIDCGVGGIFIPSATPRQVTSSIHSFRTSQSPTSP